MTRRAFVATATSVAAGMGLALSGCSSEATSAPSSEEAGNRVESAAGGVASDSAPASSAQETGVDGVVTEVVERDAMGSPDACDVRVGLIMGPPSMGLTQLITAADAGVTTNHFTFEFNDVDYVGLSAKFNQGDYDIVTLPSNIGPILYNNQELKNRYQVIAVNNLGVLYCLTTDPSIASLADLAGRRVYSYGEGGTPEYTIEALLKKDGLDGQFNLEFKSTPFEILNLLQQEENCVAILPQPFVSLSKLMVDPLYVPIDITDEWNAAFSDTGSQAVTTTTIVNRAFAEGHEQAVLEYLQLNCSSVAWSLDNMEDAAALQEELGTFMNNDVALDAMPHISMVCLTGEAMKRALSGFLEELYAANPDSIGGAVPEADFYYMPPLGSIDDDSVGADRAHS
ncbi:MAG: Tat pathway signal sequence [Eggerthellaceae bacterium]|nr:Tat pathway signal sequence [Eggerthellaceae bacterium]